MAGLNSSLSYKDSKQGRHLPIRRALKDFLLDDSNSCSANGFKSFPREPNDCTVRSLLELDGGERESNSSNANTSPTLRSRSTATTTIYAIQKASEMVINAVKSPSFLQRSLSRRLLKPRFWRRKTREERGVAMTVTRVKDIVRMKSFRDLTEEKSPPSDSTGAATSKSNFSSWSESDFTADHLASSGESEDRVGKEYSPGVGGYDTNTTRRMIMSNDAVGPKEELGCEGEQHSPVSILDFPFIEDAEAFPFFHQEGEEESEERAVQLLDRVKATGSASVSEANVDVVLLDFFRDELRKRSRGNQAADTEILKRAEGWLSGEFERGMETRREACIRDMERGGRWRMLGDEEGEIALEMEVELFGILVDELLVDVFVN